MKRTRNNRTAPVTTTAIILAAGSGKRMGSAVAKQFVEIQGKPILQYTLEKFQACDAIQEIILVVPQRDTKRLKRMIKSHWGINKACRIVAGGRERHDSAWAGLSAVDPGVDIVVIHDGVRPFVTPAIIRNTVRAAIKYGAAIVAVPPKDTIKRCDATFVLETLQRQKMVVVQTPQAFRRDIVKTAYEKALADHFYSTDDAALVERLNHRIYIVQGDYNNIKVTCPDDLLMAEAILKGQGQ